MSEFPYALIKGRIADAKPFPTRGRTRPHYHLLIEAGSAKFDVAVNIVSEDPRVADVRVLYAIKAGFTPKSAREIGNLPAGIRALPHGSDLRLDYVSDHLVTRNEMSPLPLFGGTHGGRHGGGSDAIMDLVGKAVRNPDATVYAFGHRYGKSHSPDPAWGFSPDDGVHNIHMNQGNAPDDHGDENGRHQDGALWIETGGAWSAVYVAFQTQSWDNGSDGFPIRSRAEVIRA